LDASFSDGIDLLNLNRVRSILRNGAQGRRRKAEWQKKKDQTLQGIGLKRG